ncbi:hypothetical protein [Streptomyces sp. NPDC089919]|uniref:hypothetical protein n=1 Tax=Streptomyces sp. NPDC089919 TaxID=3155188 RepID=UPI0034404C27
MDDEITAEDGNCLFTFDGRILERFGRDPLRFHVRSMHLQVTGPDRKGRRQVEISHGRPGEPGFSHSWSYTAGEWERARGLAALLEAVQAAIDAAPGRPAG